MIRWGEALPVGITAVAVLAVGAPADPAAADGNWDDGSCGDRGEACFWQGNVDNSWHVGSSTRDPDFSNDIWRPGGGTINNDAAYMQNVFKDISVRAYRLANYTNDPTYPHGTSCVSGGHTAGPYTRTSPNGLSSFRSC